MRHWLKTLLVVPVGAFLLAGASPAAADGQRGYSRVLDRVEDRLDRLENRLDRRVTLGPRDRLEDRLDRREDRFDRRHGPRASRYYSRVDRKLDRKERRAQRRALRRAYHRGWRYR
ncbi:MAG: hypothetical protein AB8B85_00340 [Paracoccaceae bacterium]